MNTLRTQVRQLYQQLSHAVSHRYAERDLARSAVVVSPHFDDETLGCGGTILKKKQAGAEVKIVFMTDGSQSHRPLMTEEELRAIRSAEGLAAARRLGLQADEVHLLGFAETRLNQHEGAAADLLTAIFIRHQPEEVFIPYRQEPRLWSEDHLTTTRVALAALRRYGRTVTVYEYPIWFWRHWPWVDVPARRRERLNKVTESVFSTVRLLTELRCSLYIGDVLEHKRAALNEHHSQMTRLKPDPRWATLGDVAGGEFLDMCLRPHEVFRRSTLPAR